MSSYVMWTNIGFVMANIESVMFPQKSLGKGDWQILILLYSTVIKY